MKNVIIVILIFTTVVVGYVAATSTLRLSTEALEGKTAKTYRGDLTLPINATGEVRPGYRIEIKAEASGEVLEIAKHAGDRVQAGDVLIRLQQDDEQRSVNRAKLDLKVAEARLEEAQLALKQAETADLQSAQARVDQLVVNVDFAKFRLEKLASLEEHQRNDEELLQRETAHKSQLAELHGARAALERAKLAIPRARQTVIQAEATHETAQNNLGDAEKRLAKTDVTSPIDGIVADIRAKVGQVIQGGKTTFTGGTVLGIVLDTDRLLVRAEVDEADIGRVLEIAPLWARPGHDTTQQMPADIAEAVQALEHAPFITVESFREEEFAGVIERIYPEPKNLAGVVTYLVDVVVTSDNRTRLLPGMRADVRFTSEHAEDVLLCPNEAIREGPEGLLGVYVPKKGSPPDQRETEFVACKFGLDDGNRSEVREGLSEGMVVYTKLPAKKDRGKKRKKRG
ncbi:MAG: HlyD family efflux transporter periplasmic adaptor subunit [Phycisphaerales bacterium]|nr:MAG: HlyD family efflux transporter periplasmic adaptor subunit [Phycisphaerales bacterium]